MSATTRWVDLAVIIAYLAGITWFGAQFRSSQHTLRDYFLGGKTAPWWAIALSIVSAETSTLTVIGTPSLAFQGDFGFLQLVLGYLLGRVIIVSYFLPAYFRGEMYTAYELMRVRFGPRIRKLTAAGVIRKDADVVAALTGNVLKDPDYIYKYHTGKLEAPNGSKIRSTFGNQSTVVPNDPDRIAALLA